MVVLHYPFLLELLCVFNYWCEAEKKAVCNHCLQLYLVKVHSTVFLMWNGVSRWHNVFVINYFYVGSYSYSLELIFAAGLFNPYIHWALGIYYVTWFPPKQGWPHLFLWWGQWDQILEHQAWKQRSNFQGFSTCLVFLWACNFLLSVNRKSYFYLHAESQPIKYIWHFVSYQLVYLVACIDNIWHIPSE